LIWFTDLIIAPTFVHRHFLLLPRPYIEPDLGPLGIIFLGLIFCEAIGVVSIWQAAARRKVAGARVLVASFAVWMLLGLHDILATVGMPAVQFLMEYGFLGFSLSIITLTIRKYIELFKIVEESEQALHKANASLEQRVKDRTTDIARSNQELKAEIRDRRRIEKALRESEEKFRTLIANCSDVIVILDRNSRIQYSSPNVTRHFGWQPEELLAQELGAAMHAEDRERVESRIVQLLAQPDETMTLTYRFRTREGDYRHIELTLVNRLDTPRIKGLVGNFRDVSARISSEQALKKAQAIAHVGHWEFDPVNKTIQGSDEWLRIYGFAPSSAKIALDQVRSLMVAEDRSKVITALNDLLYNSAEYDITFRIRRADDKRLVWLHSRAELVDNGNGRPPTVSGVLQDITPFKQAEEEKVHLENQLRQAQKMESIGTLAGGIAHDFNNILSPIIGFAEMTASDMPAGSQARSNLGEILKAGRRAQEMVQQILTFSRNNNQECKPVQITPIIQESLKLMRSSLPATIDIRSHLEDENGFVMGDATQIHQMIVNLCTNAYHAMRDTGGVLNVYLDEACFETPTEAPLVGMRPGRFTRIRIQDSGHGIAQDVLERIFEPYFTTKGPGEGTGMGLSMVHGIIKHHNGAIGVDSTLGAGTTFNLYLPQIVHKDDTSITETMDFIPLGNERLLLVDDEAPLLDMQRQMLERLGYEVTASNSSVEALSLFCHDPEAFDLIITDQTMPNLTGGELAAQALHIREDLPIILCTGFSESISPETAAEIGIRRYLNKPIALKTLARAVRLVLNDTYAPAPDTAQQAAGA
jgi:PAS domain S-box-containing protein